MIAKQLKNISTACYLLGMICALMLYTHTTFGFTSAIRVGFYVFGGTGLILSLIQFRFLPEEKREDFNLLFWIGSLVIFIGFVARILYFNKYSTPLLILGLAVTGLSFFINPLKRDKDEEDEILDN